jgi:hypothetical protein
MAVSRIQLRLNLRRKLFHLYQLLLPLLIFPLRFLLPVSLNLRNPPLKLKSQTFYVQRVGVSPLARSMKVNRCLPMSL